MKSLTIKNSPFFLIDSIEIFEPDRGEEGTESFQVNVDGTRSTFEINDDCVWVKTGKSKPLSNEINEFVNKLIDCVMIKKQKPLSILTPLKKCLALLEELRKEKLTMNKHETIEFNKVL